ncbi:hypothetical protein RRF57_001596 [Xylaria bambusicola]|uniref:Uncharacterized protein n=1 Tax=Xylaria bambusicola TaxID=326684 RepID=A0AAN7YV12_9PEZI
MAREAGPSRNYLLFRPRLHQGIVDSVSALTFCVSARKNPQGGEAEITQWPSIFAYCGDVVYSGDHQGGVEGSIDISIKADGLLFLPSLQRQPHSIKEIVPVNSPSLIYKSQDDKSCSSSLVLDSQDAL